MIKAVVSMGVHGLPAFSVEGHAGYSDEGTDIVCAAVSAVAQTAVLGLKDTPGARVVETISKGRLECRVIGFETPEAEIAVRAIVRTMALGLRSIEAGHRDHVRLNLRDIEEVSTCS